VTSGTSATELRTATTAAAQRELARLARAADVLRAAAEAVGRETDPRAVARVTVAFAARLTQAERVLVGLVEDDEFHPQAAAVGGRPAEVTDEDAEDARLVAAVRRAQQPVVTPAALAVPATDHHGRVVAVLVARKDAGRRGFTPHDARLLETLGHVAAVGFDRGRLFERLIDWNRSTEMLLAFNAAINQHLAPPELVRRLVEYAARLLNGVAGFAGLAVAGAAGTLRMEADGYWTGGAWHDRPRRWARGEGTPGFVLDTEFPYFSNDYPADPLADPALAGVVRAICVPIKNERSQVLGFFELHRGADSPLFSWHDAAVLESLANTAAVAVENARLWRSLEESNRQLQAMSAANARRLEEERRHIARELHDETGQVLIGIKLGLHALSGLVPDDLPEVRAELDVLRQQVNEAAVRIKNLAHQLRPPTLDHCGLATALRQLTDDFRRRTGLRVEVTATETDRRFGTQVETAVYRVAQEALTNTAKHAHAGTVRLTLTDLGPVLRFSVGDDGRGFCPASPTAGLGLLGMRERVAMLGGDFRLSSGPDGTVIDVTVPVADAQQA
jgi:signal transduction histidine kinase